MAAWRSAGAAGFGIGGNLYQPGAAAAAVARAAKAFMDAWTA
jgi:2-dehydro-3-deoxyphosphogalactonate aldolase